jgi:hypothetical protein
MSLSNLLLQQISLAAEAQSHVEALSDQLGVDAGGNAASWYSRMALAQWICRHPFATKGGLVWLPTGTRMLEALASRVRAGYSALGLEEYDFPFLYRKDLFDALSTLYSLDGRLMETFPKGAQVMNPSGESAFLTFFRDGERLRIGAFRRARYYRPPSSGDALFRPAEASDVFEAFQLVPGPLESLVERIMCYQACLDSVLRWLGLPVIWSLRPIWTNNSKMNEAALAADAILPDGRLLQVAAVYVPRREVLQRHGLRDDERGEARLVVAYCSRRSLLSGMVTSLLPEKGACLPPAIAPTQVVLSLPTNGGAEEDLVGALRALELRIHVDYRDASHRTVKQWLHQQSDVGVPVAAVVRTTGDASSMQVSIIPMDTRREQAIQGNADAIASMVSAALVGVTERRCILCGTVVSRKLRRAGGTNQHPIYHAVFPLEFSEEAVRAAERDGEGEIIGFFGADSQAACVATGRPTRARAYRSVRI